MSDPDTADPPATEGDIMSPQAVRAERRADSIRDSIKMMSYFATDLAHNLDQAIEDGDWQHLGYESVAEYVAGEFGDALKQLGTPQNRAYIVPLLREHGIKRAEVSEIMAITERHVQRLTNPKQPTAVEPPPDPAAGLLGVLLGMGEPPDDPDEPTDWDSYDGSYPVPLTRVGAIIWLEAQADRLDALAEPPATPADPPPVHVEPAVVKAILVVSSSPIIREADAGNVASVAQARLQVAAAAYGKRMKRRAALVTPRQEIVIKATSGTGEHYKAHGVVEVLAEGPKLPGTLPRNLTVDGQSVGTVATIVSPGGRVMLAKEYEDDFLPFEQDMGAR